MLTNCLAACARLTITVSEIQQDIGRKSSIFSYPLAFDAARRRPQQSGFTPGRSTIDAILARLLSELHQEFYQPLNVAYIDIKAAFDSMHCGRHSDRLVPLYSLYGAEVAILC